MADTCEHGMPIRMGCDDCTIGRLAADRDAFADAATEAQAERDAAREERDALTARVAELEAANARLKKNVVHMESVLHSIIHEAKVHVADGAWEMAQYLDRIRSIAVGAVGNHPAPLLSGKERSNADQA